MMKWQKRKLRDELLSLLVAVVGIVLIVTHIFDMTPWLALVGAFIAFTGLGIFADIRNKDYRKSKRAR